MFTKSLICVTTAIICFGNDIKNTKVEVINEDQKFIQEEIKQADLAEFRCLVEAVYFEARGESFEGQLAVAKTVMNRVNNPKWPKTICKVVYQNSTKIYKCQFSFSCINQKLVVKNKKSWEKANYVANYVLKNKLNFDATHYHTKSVNPNWNKKLTLVAEIGNHKFWK